jgi:uncharacterized membrane protein YoaK (UPF0700 family)
MTNKSKHTGVGIALGAALGTVLGVTAGHIAIWLSLGVAIGVALGASFQSRQECPECAVIHQKHEERNGQFQS